MFTLFSLAALAHPPLSASMTLCWVCKYTCGRPSCHSCTFEPGLNEETQTQDEVEGGLWGNNHDATMMKKAVANNTLYRIPLGTAGHCRG